MNKKANKYIYEYAKQQDGAELSAFFEETSFKGDFCLAYAKRPNAYDSVKRDSDNSVIITGRNTYNNKISGMGICSIYNLLYNSNPAQIAYLSGFRRKPNTLGNIIYIYNTLKNYCVENNVKYTYTTILSDNIEAQKMFTKKRKNLPQYIKISDYTVNIFKPKMKHNSNYVCQKATEEDFENLKNFIDFESKNKTFFPCLDLKNGFFGLTYKDFYLLKTLEGEILACGILWNQTAYKQLVVKHYSLKYRIIKKLSNRILKILSYPVLPEIDEVIDYSTLSFVLCKNDNGEYLCDFIRSVSNYVKEKLFVYASTKELNKNLAPMKYKSFVYLVDWDKNIDITKFDKENLYIECGLL